MTSRIRNQVRRIDQALLALLDERARLVRHAVTETGGAPPSSVDDLLRRYDGELPADVARRLFDVIDALCAGDADAPRPAARDNGGRHR